MATERRSTSVDAQSASVKATILVGAFWKLPRTLQLFHKIPGDVLESSARCCTMRYESTDMQQPELDVGSVQCVMEKRACRAAVRTAVLIFKLVLPLQSSLFQRSGFPKSLVSTMLMLMLCEGTPWLGAADAAAAACC